MDAGPVRSCVLRSLRLAREAVAGDTRRSRYPAEPEVLGYVVRPVVLLVVEPPPRHGDFLADARLASAGYQSALLEVLRPIVVGLVTFTVCIIAFKSSAVRIPRLAVPLRNGLVLLAAGWALRGVYYLSGESNLAETLSFMGSLAAGSVALFHDALEAGDRAAAFLRVCVVASCAVESPNLRRSATAVSSASDLWV